MTSPSDGEAGSTARMTFIGTATTVLRLGDFTFLTDPNFLHRGQRAYLGRGLWSRRRTDPAMGVEDLPALDGVILSHLHGDHFDRVARRGLNHDLPILTTRHAARRLGRRGFANAVGLAPWRSLDLTRGAQRLRVTAVPGHHGPPLASALLPPVIGAIVELTRPDAEPLRVYITGDVTFRPETPAILRRLPPVDAMLIHLGGTRVLGMLVTMDHRQGADFTEMVGASMTVPIHYDDYPVFRSPLRAFLDEMRRRVGGDTVRVVRRGDTIDLSRQERRAFLTSG